MIGDIINDVLHSNINYEYFANKRNTDSEYSHPKKVEKIERLNVQSTVINKVKYVPKILVAEDEKIMQLVIKNFLASLGCEARIFNNGESALLHYIVHYREYDALILDINMPKLRGDAVCRFIRMAMGHKIPIFAHSTFAELSMDEAKSKGVTACIQKPTKINEIAKVLETFLEGYKIPKI